MGTPLARNPGTVYNASEGAKFNAETTLAVVDCPTCGITYAIPEGLERSARKWHGDRANGWKLCCPLGHTWWYTGETRAEKLKRQLQAERDRAGRLAADRDQTAASLRAQKAAATRARRERDRERARSHAGVCPVEGCRRHFKNLERHMASKHPDLADDRV